MPPSLLAPWTLTHAHSPAAYNPFSGVSQFEVAVDSSHSVVCGRAYRDWLVDRVEPSEEQTDLADSREPRHDLLSSEMAQVQVHVRVLEGSSFIDLLLDRSAHNVTWCELHGLRRVPFHEAFSLGVDQVAAFASSAFSDEDAVRVQSRRVELDEFHVFQRHACSICDRHSVTRVDHRVGGDAVYPSQRRLSRGSLPLQRSEQVHPS